VPASAFASAGTPTLASGFDAFTLASVFDAYSTDFIATFVPGSVPGDYATRFRS
jgi:hypothetical protein